MSGLICLWPVRSLERVASAQFGESGEVTVPREQYFDAVSDADRRDACFVHGSADDMGPIHEPAQDLGKVARLAEQPA